MRILYNQKTHSYFFGQFIAIPYRHHVYRASWLVTVYKGNDNKEIIMVGASNAQEAAIYAIKAMPEKIKERALVTRLINTNGRGYYLKPKKKTEVGQKQKGTLHEEGQRDLEVGGGENSTLHEETPVKKSVKKARKARKN